MWRDFSQKAKTTDDDLRVIREIIKNHEHEIQENGKVGFLKLSSDGLFCGAVAESVLGETQLLVRRLNRRLAVEEPRHAFSNERSEKPIMRLVLVTSFKRAIDVDVFSISDNTNNSNHSTFQEFQGKPECAPSILCSKRSYDSDERAKKIRREKLPLKFVNNAVGHSRQKLSKTYGRQNYNFH